jgi:hypothetical protein
LRTKPRNLKYKAKLRARVEAEAQEATGINTVEETVEVEEPIVVEAKPKKARATKAKTAKVTKTTKKAKTSKVSKTALKADANPEETIAIKA